MPFIPCFSAHWEYKWAHINTHNHTHTLLYLIISLLRVNRAHRLWKALCTKRRHKSAQIHHSFPPHIHPYTFVLKSSHIIKLTKQTNNRKTHVQTNAKKHSVFCGPELLPSRFLVSPEGTWLSHFPSCLCLWMPASLTGVLGHQTE